MPDSNTARLTIDKASRNRNGDEDESSPNGRRKGEATGSSPLPSSLHTPPALFPDVFGSSFKRARTTSPPTSIEETGSETEGEGIAASSLSSEIEPSLGSRTATDLFSSTTTSVNHHHNSTPLRFSFGCPMAVGDKMTNSDPNSKAAAVDGLMTEKMLTINDGDSAPTSNGLPSYSQAIGQSVAVFTPPVNADADKASTVMPSMIKPDFSEQLERVTELAKQPLQVGQSWFLVDHEWYHAWSALCSTSGDAKKVGGAYQDVGMVQTRSLLKEVEGFQMVTPGLEEGIHFDVLPREAWDLLVAWYGRSDPPVERKVIKMPMSGWIRIETFPPVLQVSSVGEREMTFTVTLSVLQTLEDLKQAAWAHLAGQEAPSRVQSEVQIRFWQIQDQESPCTLASLKADGAEVIPEDRQTSSTLEELQLDRPLVRLAMEVKKVGATWPSSLQQTSSVKGIFKQDGGDFLSKMQSGKSTTPELAMTSGASTSTVGRVTRSQTAADRGPEKQRGLTGLHNLGNTCFMNAALQCMSNTKELKDYFVSGVYKSEVNTDNPLGMGGAMAKVFGELLAKLWNSGGGAWHPREFKTVLSRFSPQFIGYAQQDTQELLAFLLDGLHEDLNRIVKKPYIEAPDWEGGGVKEMVAFAHKQWEIYKLRNDSVIVDLFQGQYRSTLVCPDCGKVSIKFDPFMYLTLPIPNRKSYVRKVVYVPWEISQPLKEVEMRFTGETSIGKLKKNLAEWFGGNAEAMIACDVFHSSFFRIWRDFENASDIATSDVTYVYELPTRISPIDSPALQNSHGFHRREKVQELEAKGGKEVKEAALNAMALFPVYSVIQKSRQQSNYYGRGGGSSFGQPFFVAVPKDRLHDEEAIQEAVMEKYSQSSGRGLEVLKAEMESESGSSQEDWDMLNDTPSSVVWPDGTTGMSPDTVAEIHDGGETVHIVPAANETQREGEKAEKAKAFSLYYVLHREDQSPVTLKADGYEEYGEELHSRALRLAATLPSEEGKQQMDIDAAPDGVHSEAAEQSKVGHWPLIYTGGALVCAWTKEAKEKLFGDGEEGWGPGSEASSRFVDPELVAEREADVGGKRVKATITIDDCLSEFTREEQLGESDPWYCPQCKDFKQATKKFDLWKVPDILVVHLKRFSSGRISRDKIDSFIDFPVHGLDLVDRVEGAKAVSQLYTEEEDDEKLMESIGSLGANDDAVESDAPVYDLYAVDNHYGGLGGGHYTAYAKNPEDDRWYYFDDSSVRAVGDADEVKGSAAYLLFYRRRTTRPIGGKSREKVREKAKKEEEGGKTDGHETTGEVSCSPPDNDDEESKEGKEARLDQSTELHDDKTDWDDSDDDETHSSLPFQSHTYSTAGWDAIMDGKRRSGLLSSNGSAVASLGEEGDADSSLEADASSLGSNLSNTLDDDKPLGVTIDPI